MSILSAIPIVGGILEKIVGVVDQAVTDKDQAARLKSEIEHKLMELDYSALETEVRARAEVIAAEAKSESWLARNWRPIVMLMFAFIIFNNYILHPYLSLLTPEAPVLETPPDLWALMKLGLTGYIVGRSGEKIIERWKAKND